MPGLGLLTFLVFLVLRLTGMTDWSWGYVCLPAAFFLGASVQFIIMLNALNTELHDTLRKCFK